jgi:hypothetical protein
MLSVFLTAANSFSAGLTGIPKERADGTYYAENHGEVTELTRTEWERANARVSRLFAGGAMAFTGLAALYLTQSRPRGAPGSDAPRHRQRRPAVVRWRDWIGGCRDVTAVGPGSPADVIARLRSVAPLRPTRTTTLEPAGRVSGDWDEPSTSLHSFPILVDGDVAAVDQDSSRFTGTIKPSTPYARNLAVINLLSALGTWAFAAAIVWSWGVAGAVILAVWGVVVTATILVLVPAGRRCTGRVAARLTLAVEYGSRAGAAPR